MTLASLTQEAAVVSRQTVWEFLVAGGPVMVPIGICSVVAVAFGLERCLRLRRANVCPAATDEVLALVQQGRIAAASTAAEALRAPAGRVLLAGLRRAGLPIEDIERAMQDQGQKETEKLRSSVRLLQVIGNVAPLLGLFGTVVGLYEAFHVVAKAGMGKPETFAYGVEMALITTIAGLLVAIPTILVAAYLSGRVRRLILELDERLSPAVEQLAMARREGQDAA